MGRLSIPSNIFWETPINFCNNIIHELKDKRLLLFMNDSSIKRLLLENWYKQLKENSKIIHFNKIPSNPTYIDIYHAIRSCGNELPENIIAIGGGSVIDMAKACSGLMYLKDEEYFNEKQILDSLKEKEYLKHSTAIPIYAVPTTAGTGSEVTSWATVWDMESKIKYSIDAPWLLPKRAYMVAEFTKTMPSRLTLSTGLDALCQAIEAYWAKASNPMVKVLSKSAIEIIVEYLPKTLQDLDNLYFREKMCLGSLFSGLAFSNTRTTACHSISYPLTMKFGIEHGIACALTLSKVMTINLPSIDEADELLSALNAKTPEQLQGWIDDLSNEIVKMRLSEFGISETDIDELVNLSFTQGRMDNNPVNIAPEDVRIILKEIL